MWDTLPFDLLTHILSYLPFPSLVRCLAVSKHFHSAATSTTTTSSPSPLAPPLPSSSSRIPTNIPSLSTSSPFRILLSNPFTRRSSFLPSPSLPRSNPAVGLIMITSNSFRILLAGGAVANGSTYQQSLELFDSSTCRWSTLENTMPLEFSVRLTVWMPQESVHTARGFLYWMTLARVYSMVGYDCGEGRWWEVKVPMAERLEWAGIVRRGNGRVGVVAGLEGGEGGFVWEMVGEEWVVVGEVPRLKGRRVRCVGSEGVVYLVGEGEGDVRG